MKTQSPDTQPEVERVQVALLRHVGDPQRFALIRSLSRTVIQFSRQAIREARPNADEAQLQRTFISLHYGQEIVDGLGAKLSQKVTAMEMPDILEVMTPIVDAFEQLGVAYHIGGSVASSLHGIGRATADIDLVADLRLEHVRPFVKLLEASYYVDEDAVRSAVAHRTSFGMIQSAMVFKVDIFLPKASAFDRQVFQRLQQKQLEAGEHARRFYLASAEDMVLKKLDWYKAGGMVSDQQWKDVLGILKVQANALDLAYLRQWAGQLGLSDLLERALDDAGLTKTDAPNE